MPFNQPLTGKIEPIAASWRSATPAERKAFYERAGREAVGVKRSELTRAIGANGRTMKPRKHPRPDGANGPVLTPHDRMSRTDRLMAAKATDRGCTLFWHSGIKRGQKKPWGTILGYHADGKVKGAPVRDVRLSTRGIGSVRKAMAKWWTDFRSAATRDANRARLAAEAAASQPTGSGAAPKRGFFGKLKDAAVGAYRKLKGAFAGQARPAPATSPRLTPSQEAMARRYPRLKPYLRNPKQVPDDGPGPSPVAAPVKPSGPSPLALANLAKAKARAAAEAEARAKAKPKVQARPRKSPATEAIPKQKVGRLAIGVGIEKASAFGDAGSRGAILPDRPIGERIEAYDKGIGGLKRKALESAVVDATAEAAGNKQRYDALKTAYRVKAEVLYAPRSDAEFEADRAKILALKAEVAGMEADLKALERKGLSHQEAARAAVRGVLAVDKPIAIEIAPEPAGSNLWKFKELKSPEHKVLAAIKEGKDWLAAMVRDDGRGTFPVGFGQHVGTGRAEHVSYANTVVLDHFDEATTVVHELGHALENNYLADWKTRGDSLVQSTRKFLEHRVGNEQSVSLRKKFGKEFDKDEKGRKDRFDEAFDEIEAHYIGKDYADATEVLAMGLQKLHDDPLTLLRKDPEYANFLLGILDGSLR